MNFLEGNDISDSYKTKKDYKKEIVMKKDLHSLFKIKNVKQRKPRYQIVIEMDSNDGDYIKEIIDYEVKEFESLPDIVLYALMYLGHGYKGKFSHGEDWGDYYGHHFDENKHGLDFLGDVMKDNDLMCYTDWGSCHSYAGIDIKYIDEHNCIHPVTLPNIDTLFNSEEEMIKEIKRAYEEYEKEYE